MEVLILLRLVIHWLLVVGGAGALLWLATMMLALSGWTMWIALRLFGRFRKLIGSAATAGQDLDDQVMGLVSHAQEESSEMSGAAF